MTCHGLFFRRQKPREWTVRDGERRLADLQLPHGRDERKRDHLGPPVARLTLTLPKRHASDTLVIDKITCKRIELAHVDLRFQFVPSGLTISSIPIAIT